MHRVTATATEKYQVWQRIERDRTRERERERERQRECVRERE